MILILRSCFLCAGIISDCNLQFTGTNLENRQLVTKVAETIELEPGVVTSLAINRNAVFTFAVDFYEEEKTVLLNEKVKLEANIQNHEKCGKC